MNVPLSHPFYFDGNQWFGKVETREDWWELIAVYPDIEAVLKANKAMVTDTSGMPKEYFLGAQGVRDGSLPSFGFRREHIVDKGVTLEQWAQARGINLRILAERKPSA